MIMKRDQGMGTLQNSLAPQLTSLSQASYSMNDISTHSDTIAGTKIRRSQLPSFSSSQQSSSHVGSLDGKMNYPGLLTQPADLNSYHFEDPTTPPFLTNQFRGERTTPSRDRLPEVPEEHTPGDNGINRGKPPHSHHNGMSRSSSQASQKSGGGGSHGIHDLPNQRPFLGNLSFSQPGGLDSVSNRGYPSRYEVRKRSLGSPMDDNKGLHDLAISSIRTRRGSAGGILNQTHRSKVSTGSVGSTEDSAYSTGNSSRSLNHFHSDDHSLSPSIFDLPSHRERSPPIDTAIQKISPTSPVNSDQMSSSLEDFKPCVEWEVKETIM